MIQVEYKFKLGTDEFTLRAEVQTQQEFFQAMSFYANLPKVGPNGEEDLKLTYRSIKEFEYYSIVCQSAGMEYRFGQYKNGSGLFEKGWEPLYNPGNGERDDDEHEASRSSGSRFSKPEKAAPKASTKVSNTTDDDEDGEIDDAQSETAVPTEQPKVAAPATKSKMADLMAKYGTNKSQATTAVRR